MTELFATCALGTEPALAQELKALRMHKVRQARGGVSFIGDDDAGMLACLHLRSAMRVLTPLASFEGTTAEALYEGVRAIPWKEHLSTKHTFAVEATGGSESLRHTGFIALKAKDAIVDAMRESVGARPDVDARNPDVPVVIHVHGNKVDVSLDLGGKPLHRRGYRPQQVEAPLKETLAAAILILAGYTGEEPFCDPMAGSGTLVVEAAWMAMRRPPGLGRHFAFERWPGFAGERQSRWHKMQHQARAAMRTEGLPPILARERFAGPMEKLEESLERAQVRPHVTVEKGDVRDLRLPPTGGILCTNPPYAERLGKPLQILGLYRGMGEAAKHWGGWKVHILAGHKDFERAFGHHPVRRHALFNGPIRCQLLSYELPPPA
ncbi:MAG: THUMP domain-containing protein [Myxococcota bacterium]